MQALGFLLLILPAADPVMPPSTRVNLTGAQPLAKYVAALSQQVNVTIDLDRAVRDRSIALDLKSVLFWEAIERLAQTADHRLVISSQGGKISLIGGEPYRVVPIDIQGPFRISAKRSISKLDVETGQRICEVQVAVVWEPRFKAFYAEVPAKPVAAQIDPDRELRVLDDGSSKMPVSGQGIEITIRLANVPRSASRLSLVRGMLKFAGTSQLLQFAFAADKSGSASVPKQSGVAASLQSLQKRGRIWTAVVQFEYPKGGPEFESFQSFLLDNECWLQRGDGAKFTSIGFEVGSERAGAIPVHYHFQENAKTGFTIEEVRGWKIVVRTPGPIVEVPLRFTLKDVPLP